MHISPLDLLLLLGALQGFILTGLLWFNRRGQRLSNRLLAGLTLVLSLACFNLSVPLFHPVVSLILDFLPFILVMPLGPLLYFYTRSLLDPGFSPGRKEKWQFVPVVFDAGGAILAWVFVALVLSGVIKGSDGPKWAGYIDLYNQYVDIPRWMSLTVYLFLTYRLLRGSTVPEERRQVHLNWLKHLTGALFGFQLLWLLFLIPYEIPALSGKLLDLFGWYPLYIPIAGLIYWIGLRGYLHTYREVPTPRVALPEEETRDTAKLLQQAMEQDRLFLDPELTVDRLGKHLSLPPKRLSATLNQYLGRSFNDFVNQYRVEEVQQRLLDPDARQFTILGIAHDCGFNSQATFQRAFRKVTGQSPTEYLEQQKKERSQIGI
jgi:AraC-like DNA-binding protein